MTSERVQPLRELVIACGWRGLVVRAAILGVAWWTLNEGDLTGVAFGIVIVVLALLASVALPAAGSPTWRPVGLARFAGVFVIGSIRGGVDVARRAFARALPMSPEMISYPLRLRAGSARHLFMGAVSLMPGTLGVVLDGHQLEIHVLVADAKVRRSLEHLELSIARAVGQRLEPADA